MIDVRHIQQSVSDLEGVWNNEIPSIARASERFEQQYQQVQSAVLRIAPDTHAVTQRVLNDFVERLERKLQVAVRQNSDSIQLSVNSDLVSSISTDNPVTSRSKESNYPRSRSVVPRCQCRRQERRRTNEIKCGPLRMFIETTASTNHHITCPYYLNTVHSTRIGVGTRFISTLLSRVVEGTISGTFGDGGISITPSLSLRFVYHPDSPAFQLLDQLPTYGQNKTAMKMSPEDLRAEMHSLLQTRRASPYDVDQDGRTLLHVSFPTTQERLVRLTRSRPAFNHATHTIGETDRNSYLSWV